MNKSNHILKRNSFRYQWVFILFILGSAHISEATNYFVNATSGNNSYSGLSPDKAFKTLQKAAGLTVAGDTVFVMNGTYRKDASWSSDVVIEESSGTESAWIVWINYPGHKPKISFDCWRGFSIKGSYVEVNGLTIQGNNSNLTLEEALNQPKSCANPSGSFDARFNGNGISADGRSGNRYHHITIKNCEVYDCGGAGISFIQSDYITIENNIVYNNSWYTLWASSGISLWQNWNSDNATGLKNIIRNNICYGNWQYVPAIAFNCSFTDGNGIIIDDSDNTQNGSALGSYQGRTLIENNLVFRNGGSGIHTFLSRHVDIINNTAYMNSLSEHLNGGQIFPNASADIRIFNNILVASAGKRINSNWNNKGGIIYDYNLHFGGSSTSLTGIHTIVADPQFIDAAKNDYRLDSKSPAVDAGISSLGGTAAPSFDIINNMRPYNDKYDIGAYEHNPVTSAEDRKIRTTNKRFSVFPNPASDYVMVAPYDMGGDFFEIFFFNMMGQMLLKTEKINLQETVKINLNLPPGQYYLVADDPLYRYHEKLVIR
jgi:parallel beta-helix repeat protein